jgi:quinol monooxygenase YgiN
VVILAEMFAKPEAQAEVKAILENLVEQTRTEPGAVAYLLHQQVDEPRRFLVYEFYAGAAAVDAHMNSSYLQDALKRFESLLAEPPRLLACDPPTGFGIAPVQR